ncbi:MAG: cytidylate kinase family protein, partial [Acidobacteria bacterium]|nr:cytidylate kinase family protein [Acidobacteriota bacterium]
NRRLVAGHRLRMAMESKDLAADDSLKHIQQAADLIADAERRKGFLERVLTSMATSGSGMAYEASVERFNPPRKAEALIRAAISEIASQGSVVIGAHAAAMQLGGGPDVLRALLTASDETRIARIRDEVGLDEEAAAAIHAAGSSSLLSSLSGVTSTLTVGSGVSVGVSAASGSSSDARKAFENLFKK